MNVTVWRISLGKYRDCAFNGEGTFKRGGRWNSKGRYIVYASDSLALASREYLAGIPLAELVIPSLVYFQVDIDERMIEAIDEKKLPRNWMATEHTKATQKLGNGWYDAGRSLVLRVPSAIIPVGHNYLLNRKHPDFDTLVISKDRSFAFDERTENILAKAMIEEELERKRIITIKKR
jgi:RES domain-containing protein